MSGGNTVVELWSDQGTEVVELQAEATVEAVHPPVDEQYWAGLETEAGASLSPTRRSSRYVQLGLAILGFFWLSAVTVTELPFLASQIAGVRAPTLVVTSHLIAALMPGALLICAAIVMITRARNDDTVSLRELLAKVPAEREALTQLIVGAERRMDASAAALHGQGERLDALGTATVNKVATLRAMIDEEIAQIAVQTNSLKNAAAAARSDMAVLLANLPKAQVEMHKIAEALHQAGGAANTHSLTLIEQFDTLSEQATRAEMIAVEAADLLGKQIGLMERQTTAAQTQIASGVETLKRAENEHLTMLTHQIAQINGELVAVGHRLESYDGLSARVIDRVRDGLADVEARLGAIDTHGSARTERLTEAIKALIAHSHQLREELALGGDKTHALIAQAEGLMVALDSATRELDESLPAALARVVDQSKAVSAHVDATSAQVGNIHQRLAYSAAAIADGGDVLRHQVNDVNALNAALEVNRTQLAGLAEQLNEVHSQIDAVAGAANADLIDALMRVKETAAIARDRAQEALRNVIPEAAAAISTASETAFTEAFDNLIKPQLANVSDVAATAVSAANDATDRLMRQMLTITEASAAFVTEMEAIEASNDASTQMSISRRVSLLVESLNSIAIDVTKILSNEVTDAAWASYLKGDRGIFTRRAVKLVDNADTREILRHYEADGEFRDHVNRYIHDFEAMLRVVLNARETGPLSVTLLSSDMGKLYVALAHAIERLRA